MASKLVTSWRLRKAGLSHGVVLFDLRNAFGAVSHDAVGVVDGAYALPQDAPYMKQVHRVAGIRLDGLDGTRHFVPRDGMLQGHQPAPLKSVRTMAVALRQWHEQGALDMRLRGGLWHQATTVFVDDVATPDFLGRRRRSGGRSTSAVWGRGGRAETERGQAGGGAVVLAGAESHGVSRRSAVLGGSVEGNTRLVLGARVLSALHSGLESFVLGATGYAQFNLRILRRARTVLGAGVTAPRFGRVSGWFRRSSSWRYAGVAVW